MLCGCVVSWRCGGSRVLVVVLCGSLDLFFVVSNQTGKGTGPNGDPDSAPRERQKSSPVIINVEQRVIHFQRVVVHVVVHVRRVGPLQDFFFWWFKRCFFLEFKILRCSQHA